MPVVDEVTAGRIFRAESGRSVAALISAFGDIDVAEDAVQEAFAVALLKWPADGLPPNPGGWIIMTARNRAIDRLRREARERHLLGTAMTLPPPEPGPPEEEGPVRDDRLPPVLAVVYLVCNAGLSRRELSGEAVRLARLLAGLMPDEPEVAELLRVLLVGFGRTHCAMPHKFLRSMRGGTLPPNLLSASPRDAPIAEAKGTPGASGAVV